MSYRSKAVKDWRKRTKQRMIDAMGGSCVICGYNKCTRSLGFHHLDPSQKDFSFGCIRADIKSWDAIVQELRKCILVCNNCHGEIHEGVTAIPETVKMFDESFTNYKQEKIEKFDNCPVCGALKRSVLVTCSRKCAGKRTWRIDWSKYDLLEMSKRMSVVKIADEIGVSDSAVHKRMRKLNILR